MRVSKSEFAGNWRRTFGTQQQTRLSASLETLIEELDLIEEGRVPLKGRQRGPNPRASR